MASDHCHQRERTEGRTGHEQADPIPAFHRQADEALHGCSGTEIEQILGHQVGLYDLTKKQAGTVIDRLNTVPAGSTQ